MDITIEDVKQIQNNMYGYDVSICREFEKEIKKLCSNFGLIDDKERTVSDLLIELLVHEAIQTKKSEKQLLENEKGEYGYV